MEMQVLKAHIVGIFDTFRRSFSSQKEDACVQLVIDLISVLQRRKFPLEAAKLAKEKSARAT